MTAYVRVLDVAVGTRLECFGFDCMGGVVTVKEDEEGFYVECSHGRHYLAGQLEEPCEAHYVGFYPLT